jgi:hypothetical protein
MNILASAYGKQKMTLQNFPSWTGGVPSPMSEAIRTNWGGGILHLESLHLNHRLNHSGFWFQPTGKLFFYIIKQHPMRYIICWINQAGGNA